MPSASAFLDETAPSASSFLDEEPADVPSLDPQVVTPEDETLPDRIKKFLFEPEGAKTLREGIQGAVEAIPHMAVDTAKMGYKGLRMAMGGPEERTKILTEDVIPSALAQGQQTAADIQSPFGTPEFLRGATQMGMMAAPGLELFRELRAPVEIPREIPPVQAEPTLAERITQPRVEPAPEEPLAPVTPETPPAPVTGDLWYSGVGPEGETTWVTSNLEKAKIYAQRRGAGGRINVYKPEQVGETAFADMEGNLMSPQEYARTQSQDTTLQVPPQAEGKALPTPFQTLDASGNPIAETAPPPPTQADVNGQILERRKGILARKAELTARAANGEQGLETQLAAVEAELNDTKTNPVVHAPPVESGVAAPEVPLSRTHVGTDKPYRSAALRYSFGEVVEAPSHAQALLNSPYASEAGFESGFVTHAGEFVPYTGEIGAYPEVPAPTTRAPEPYTPEAAAARAAQPEAPPIQGPSEPVGGNVAGFEKVYGPGEIEAGGTINPEDAWDTAQARAQSGKAKPYGFVNRARTGAITPEEMGDLIYEHHRLVERAAGLEGMPEYADASQAAKDFASNVLKPAETAWHQKGMVMQIERPVNLNTFTGMDQLMQTELGRGIKPSEAPKFKRMAEDVKNGESEVAKAVERSDARVRTKYAKVRDIPIEEAVARVKQMLKDCM